MAATKIVEKTFKIYETTYAGIQEHAKCTGVEEGHVIDLVFSKFQPREAAYAILLLDEYLLMLLSELPKEEASMFLLHTMVSCGGALVERPEDADKICEFMKKRLKDALSDKNNQTAAELAQELHRCFNAYMKIEEN